MIFVMCLAKSPSGGKIRRRGGPVGQSEPSGVLLVPARASAARGRDQGAVWYSIDRDLRRKTQSAKSWSFLGNERKEKPLRAFDGLHYG